MSMIDQHLFISIKIRSTYQARLVRILLNDLRHTYKHQITKHTFHKRIKTFGLLYKSSSKVCYSILNLANK